MKYLPLAIILCIIFLSEIIYAQNTSTIKNGEEINEPVNSLLNIEFKSFGNKYYEGFQRIKKNVFISKIKQHPAAFKQYKKGEFLTFIGDITGLPASFVFGYNLGIFILRGNANRTVGAISGGITIFSLIVKNESRKKFIKSVSNYNQSDKIGLNVTENGIGVVVRF